MPLTYGSTAEIPQVEAGRSAAGAHPAQRQGLTLSGVFDPCGYMSPSPDETSVTRRDISEEGVDRRTRIAVRGHILRSH